MPAIPLPNAPLTDGDIRLRRWDPRDAPAVTAACQDPEIPRWTVVPPTDWALTSLGLERLELLAHPQNEASQRLAERAGFTHEGTLRRYRRRHGVREDLVMFSLLAEDLE